MPDGNRDEPPQPQGHSLGEMLRAARESGGLDLSEVSRSTSVRRDYLEALEESRFADLPEPVYVRNFVRLFAQAVGLDQRVALEMYSAEVAAADPQRESADADRRRPAAGAAAAIPAAERSDPAAVRDRSPRPPGRRPGFGTWLPSLILVLLVVGLAVWGFNSTLFRPGTVTEQPPTDPVITESESEEPEAGPLTATTVRLSVSTEPAGARVLVDSFPLEGLTPISLAPVTARDSRLIRVELEGFEPQETSLDMTFDRNISFVLQEAQDPPEQESAEGAPATEAVAAAGTITVSVTDESWLEIYPGTAREGTPHVYTTAQSGQEYTFDLPVFVRAGNAAGVSVSVAGQNLGPLGSAGEITGRAFTDTD